MSTPKYKAGQKLECQNFRHYFTVEVLFSEFDTLLNCQKYAVKRGDGYIFLTHESVLRQIEYKWGDRVEILYQGAWQEGKYIVCNEEGPYCHAVLVESDNNVAWGTHEDVRRKACI